VITEEASSAVRRASKWAEMGLVVGTGPPVDPSTCPAENSSSDKLKKTAIETLCKEKNSSLAR